MCVPVFVFVRAQVDVMPRLGVLFWFGTARGVGSARHSSSALSDRMARRTVLIGRKHSGHSDDYQLKWSAGRVINLTLSPLPRELWTGQWPRGRLQSQRSQASSLSLFLSFFYNYVLSRSWLHS